MSLFMKEDNAVQECLYSVSVSILNFISNWLQRNINFEKLF